MPLWQRVAARFALAALRADVRSAAGRLGDAVGGPLSHRALRAVHLPPIVPHDAISMRLRSSHTYLAMLLFATFLAHLAAAMFHGLICRDGVFSSMMPWRARAGRAELSVADNRSASDESRPV